MTKKIRFIGDVHGHIREYLHLTDDIEHSVQIGDMGAGFVDVPVLSGNHRFIRGNHDNPSVCRQHPNIIPDGTIEGDVMYIGGAFSIDKNWRTEGVNWWPEEELTILEMDDILTKAITFQPKVMVTHDCPSVHLHALFGYDYIIPNRTGQWMNSVYDYVQPDIWIFGHHHANVDMVIGRTRFICLNELAHIDLEV